MVALVIWLLAVAAIGTSIMVIALRWASNSGRAPSKVHVRAQAHSAERRSGPVRTADEREDDTGRRRRIFATNKARKPAVRAAQLARVANTELAVNSSIDASAINAANSESCASSTGKPSEQAATPLPNSSELGNVIDARQRWNGNIRAVDTNAQTATEHEETPTGLRRAE